MHLIPVLSNIVAKICTFYVADKNKRRLMRQNINMRFGIVSGELVRFVKMVQMKYHDLLEQADKIDTVCIGDSHAEYGCLPFLISEGAYNFALTANGLYEIYKTLQIATDKCPNIKNVICFVSFYQCGYSEIRGSGAKQCQALDGIFGIEYDYSLNKEHNYALTARALAPMIYYNRKKEKNKKEPRNSCFFITKDIIL